MLSPKELYKEYSINPCTSSLASPYSQLSSSEVFDEIPAGQMGAGTPMNWSRIISFFKHLKHPCYRSAPGYSEIYLSGKNKLGLTFKFLQELDIDAYRERQPTVRAGTSHSVRNCCDITRACYLTTHNSTDKWYARMATEYLEYFAHNSLPDCLMMCGQDLIDPIASEYYRAPGYIVNKNEPYYYSGASYYDSDGQILAKFAREEFIDGGGMFCFIPTGKGVAGAAHGCVEYAKENDPTQVESYCESCDECEKDPETGEPKDPTKPCCNEGTIYYYNDCCGSRATNREIDFSLWVKSDDGYFNGTIRGGRIGEKLKHIGILERKLHGGCANFSSQCSGSEPPICLDDMFFDYFQSQNGWNYQENIPLIVKDNDENIVDPNITRVRTISLILDGYIDRKANVQTNTDWMVQSVKDLLWNGYGVLLLTNVGFSNIRDSSGMSYPDRISYQTYNIIGYDDRKREFNECVYVLQCPFGKWNSGGHPSWGPLPDGSFLITESHLKCIISYYPGADFYGCRKKPCETKACFDDPAEVRKAEGCGPGYADRCDPFYCTPQQRACGFLFTMSLGKGFTKQNLDHSKYYPVESFKGLFKEEVLYYNED